jgi:DNA-directed RNA polymerase subunit N (RpoN/RPB10)
MKVNCLSCGHSINLEDDTYGDYDGAVKCYACGAILEVKLVEARLKSVKVMERTSRDAAEGKSKSKA